MPIAILRFDRPQPHPAETHVPGPSARLEVVRHRKLQKLAVEKKVFARNDRSAGLDCHQLIQAMEKKGVEVPPELLHEGKLRAVLVAKSSSNTSPAALPPASLMSLPDELLLNIYEHVITGHAVKGKKPVIHAASVASFTTTLFGSVGKPGHISNQPGLLRAARVSARLFKVGLEAVTHANRIAITVFLSNGPTPPRDVFTTRFSTHIRHLTLLHHMREGDGWYPDQVKRFDHTLKYIEDAVSSCGALKSLVIAIDISPEYWREWNWSESSLGGGVWADLGSHVVADLATVTMTLRSTPHVATFIEFQEDKNIPEMNCRTADLAGFAVALLSTRRYFRDSTEPLMCEEDKEIAKLAAEHLVQILDFQHFADGYAVDERLKGTIWLE